MKKTLCLVLLIVVFCVPNQSFTKEKKKHKPNKICVNDGPKKDCVNPDVVKLSKVNLPITFTLRYRKNRVTKITLINEDPPGSISIMSTDKYYVFDHFSERRCANSRMGEGYCVSIPWDSPKYIAGGESNKGNLRLKPTKNKQIFSITLLAQSDL